jgi:hypothetical protein
MSRKVDMRTLIGMCFFCVLGLACDTFLLGGRYGQTLVQEAKVYGFKARYQVDTWLNRRFTGG